MAVEHMTSASQAEDARGHPRQQNHLRTPRGNNLTSTSVEGVMTDKTFSFEGLVQLDGAADAGVCGPDGCTPAASSAADDEDPDEPDRRTADGNKAPVIRR